jgi:hypothetical protein
MKGVKNFDCLQCGICCYSPRIEFDNGEVKPPETPCRHLEVDSVQDKTLNAANCAIHGTGRRPEICRDFTNGQLGGPCTRGIYFWKGHVDREFVDLDKIPEKARIILEGIYRNTSK